MYQKPQRKAYQLELGVSRSWGVCPPSGTGVPRSEVMIIAKSFLADSTKKFIPGIDEPMNRWSGYDQDDMEHRLTNS